MLASILLELLDCASEEEDENFKVWCLEWIARHHGMLIYDLNLACSLVILKEEGYKWGEG